jgi:hypothetical protein
MSQQKSLTTTIVFGNGRKKLAQTSFRVGQKLNKRVKHIADDENREKQDSERVAVEESRVNQRLCGQGLRIGSRQRLDAELLDVGVGKRNCMVQDDSLGRVVVSKLTDAQAAHQKEGRKENTNWSTFSTRSLNFHVGSAATLARKYSRIRS